MAAATQLRRRRDAIYTDIDLQSLISHAIFIYLFYYYYYTLHYRYIVIYNIMFSCHRILSPLPHTISSHRHANMVKKKNHYKINGCKYFVGLPPVIVDKNEGAFRNSIMCAHH